MDYFWYSYIFVLGGIVGSFLGVCICRIPAGESIVTGRSHCPDCGHVLGFHEMIPILSYLFLGGRCKKCGAKIPAWLPLVEAVTALYFLLAAMRYGFTAYTALLCVFGCILIVLSGIDLKTMEIPDILHLWILALGILHLLLTKDFLLPALIGLVAISLPMLILAVFTDGFGGGDIKLCAVCGLFLGHRMVLFGFFAACIFASVIGIFRLLRGSLKAKTPFAFGPYLAAGFLFAALYGESLLTAYLSLFVTV